MRLIIPIIIIVLGMLAGAVVCKLFNQIATGLKLSMIAGGIGAFAGLVARDALDITTGSSQGDALLGIIAGAMIFSAAINLFLARTDDK